MILALLFKKISELLLVLRQKVTYPILDKQDSYILLEKLKKSRGDETNILF